MVARATRLGHAFLRLRGVPRRTISRLTARPIILMYHRVVDLPADPQLLAVGRAHFAEQLEVLRERFRPASLNDIRLQLADGRLDRRTVVVTIDDGYADNLLNARPLLERFEVPATIFIATA